MGFLVGFFVYLIIRGALSRNQATSHRIERKQWGPALVIVLWVLAVTFLHHVPGIDGALATAITVLSLVTVMQPGLWGRVAFGRGWVRTAYFLGRSALWVNRCSLVGGGLFYGWRALQHDRGHADRYQAGLAFLQGRLQRNARRLDSGALLMQLLLQQDTMEEGRFYRRLSSAGYLDKSCVQPALARHVFRLLAAHALARSDWDGLMWDAHAWRKHCRIPLADRLGEHYRKRRYGVSRGRGGGWWGRGRAPAWVGLLPEVSPEAAPPPAAGLSGEVLRLQTWSLGEAAMPEALEQAWRRELETPSSLAAWHERARALGCRDVDAAVGRIAQSLGEVLERSSACAAGATAPAADVDRLFEVLRFKARALDSRQAAHRLLDGSLEFEDFLNLMEVFDRFDGDPLRQHQAYGIFEYAVWNWMAELWNHGKERALAYYVCARLYPYAKSVGSPAARVYGQIVNAQLR